MRKTSLHLFGVWFYKKRFKICLKCVFTGKKSEILARKIVEINSNKNILIINHDSFRQRV